MVRVEKGKEKLARNECFVQGFAYQRDNCKLFFKRDDILARKMNEKYDWEWSFFRGQ